MAQFIGQVQGGRTMASRLGHKNTGLRVDAKSWGGEVAVTMWHDDATGVDHVGVLLQPHGGGTWQQTVCLYRGPVDGWKNKHLVGTIGRMLLDDEARELKNLTSA